MIKIYNDEQYCKQESEISVETYSNGSWNRIFDEIDVDNEILELIKFSKNEISRVMFAKKMMNISYFKNLPLKSALDIKYWTTLCLEYFPDYTFNSGIYSSTNRIKYSVFKVQSRDLISRHLLASIWWQANLLSKDGVINWRLFERLDSAGEGKLEITQSTVFKSGSNLYNFISAILEIEDEGIEIKNSMLSILAKELNYQGGFLVLDILDAEDYKKIILKVIKDENGKKIS